MERTRQPICALDLHTERGERRPALEMRARWFIDERRVGKEGGEWEEVVPVPDRVDAEGIGSEPCLTIFLVGSPLRREMDADLDGGHDVSSARAGLRWTDHG
jgi:hypothetical protein